MSQTFFTFADGALGYDCVRCGAACCRTTTIGLELAREAPRLARLGIGLGMRMAPAKPGRLLFPTADGCSFLATDGRCSIEAAHGRAAKPATCRLFPFNDVYWLGEVMVVDVRASFCPVEETPGGAGQRWAPLRAELEAERSSTYLANRHPLTEGALELGWQAHEEQVRDAAFLQRGAADYVSFAAFQEALAAQLLASEGCAAPPAEAIAARAPALAGMLAQWRALSGISGAPGLAEAARTAARLTMLMTPSIRLSCAFVHEPMTYREEIERLPRLLLALSHLVELECLLRARAPTLRMVRQLFDEATPLACVLGSFDQPARLLSPLPSDQGPEIAPAARALSAALEVGCAQLGDRVLQSLAPFPPAVRGLAVAALVGAAAALHLGSADEPVATAT